MFLIGGFKVLAKNCRPVAIGGHAGEPTSGAVAIPAGRIDVNKAIATKRHSVATVGHCRGHGTGPARFWIVEPGHFWIAAPGHFGRPR